MHVLITGGTGFIGLELVAGLLRDGHEVTVLTRDPAEALRRLPLRAQAIDALAPLKGGVDAVVNLAGENLGAGRWSEARKRVFRTSRLETTRRLVGWMAGLAQRPAVMVSGSAIGYYGARGEETVAEDSCAGSDFSAGLCRDWEAEAMKAEALGLRVCTLRTGIVLGRSRGEIAGALAQMLPAFRLGGGGPMGSGRQWMSWIHLADELGLIRWLIDTATAQGAYNGTAPQPARNAEFAQALGAALHRPAFLPMPGFALKLIVGEMAEILLTGQKVLPQRCLGQGYVFRFPGLEAALRDVLG
ncbi:MAG: TIGR01777 family oxidoreductase [Nevskia sp.]